MKKILTYDRHEFFLSPNSSQKKRARTKRIDLEARKMKALELEESGMNRKDIASEMFILECTVSNYINNAKCILYDRIKEKFKDITTLL